MGFKRSTQIYKLVFEDGSLEGLEIRVRSATLGQFLELTKLADLTTKSKTDLTQEDIEKMSNLFSVLAGCIESWNYEEEDGTPVVPSQAALANLSLKEVMEVVGAWMKATTEVSVPLGQRSNPGNTELEDSMVMAALASPVS